MPFILDTDILGGSDTFAWVETLFSERGRSIQLKWQQSGSDSEMELFGFSLRLAPAETDARELS